MRTNTFFKAKSNRNKNSFHFYTQIKINQIPDKKNVQYFQSCTKIFFTVIDYSWNEQQ
jgi:hypothetical protein